MTIIQIRGTSGSGKSTLTRRIMELYPTKTRVKISGRKQPLGYMLSGMGDRQLAVIGHYETPCGGCDTIPSLDEIYRLVRQSHEQGHDVLFEGLLISSEINRSQALHDDGLPFHILQLDTPLQLCLDSVNARRRAKRGDDAPGVNPKNTESKFKGTVSTCNKLKQGGVDVITGDRDGLLLVTRRLLNV